PSDATPVIVSDTVPAGMTLLSVDPAAGWACTTTGATVSCSGSLVSGATQIFTVHARVNSSSPPTDTGQNPNPPPLVNKVTITSTATTDPLPNNNTGPASTVVGPRSSDLSITKTIGPGATAP